MAVAILRGARREARGDAALYNRGMVVCTTRRVAALVSVLAAIAAIPSASAVSLRAAQELPLRARLIAAEHARAQSEQDLAVLRQGLAHPDPATRRQAVRAIGRLERPDLIPLLTRALADRDPAVRREAANAVGQAATDPKGVAAAKMRLLARARVEQDPEVWAVVAATLGRLRYTTAADVADAEETIARVLPTSASTSVQIDALAGAVEGLEALARQSGKIARLTPKTIAGLRAAAQLQGRAEQAETFARIRRLATLALSHAGAAVRPQLESGMADPDPEVRRLTMAAARGTPPGEEGIQEIVGRGLRDPHPQVRYEALQTWGRAFLSRSCRPALDALDDASPHVALLAIDLLGGSCPEAERARVVARLEELVDLVPEPGAWHRPAHAIVSLARVAPDAAGRRLPAFAAHAVWQVRMYAARAAGVLGNEAQLLLLARDAHHNVAEAALRELAGRGSREAEAVALEALRRSDYQLVMTAARAIEKASDSTRAIAALVESFERIEAEKRDTSRDAREAIRRALAALGGPALPEPRPLVQRLDPIDLQAIERLAATRLRIHMRDRGLFELRLLSGEAPITSRHIAALAREGYYDGLTFHRVAPNFVIQGGSPGANEYAGQGPYMRDEVGLVSHRRGTVGISTRGRDTGDAQIFINLVDSPRLDHVYTVFAEVASGMEVVDAILEGDVIERVQVMDPPAASRR